MGVYQTTNAPAKHRAASTQAYGGIECARISAYFLLRSGRFGRRIAWGEAGARSGKEGVEW